MIETAVRGRRRLLVTLVVVALYVVVPARPALAHVDLVESVPGDGQVLEAPVEELRLEFSTAATLANDGVVVYDASAAPVEATVTVVSPTEILVVPSEPLADGAWAVTWSMQAPDAHPTNGGFEFTVRVPAPPSDVEGAATDTTVQQSPVPGDEPATPSILDEVLPTGSWLAGALGAAARALSLGGALIAIGSLAFALMVFEGSHREARLIGYWIRRAGVAIVAAVPLEIMSASLGLAGGGVLGSLAISNLADAVAGTIGIALILRLIGGLGVVAGTRLVVLSPDERSHQEAAPGPVAVVQRERLHVAASPAALLGAGVVAISFLFDGHTVVAQPAVLVHFAALVHVLGGAVWLAGVSLLARLLLGRRLAGEPLDAARLVVPFSTVAGAAVAMIGLAGGVLALSIADGVGTFFTTGWGRALLVKLLLAAAAGAIGAYNHRFVVPALRADPQDTVAEEAIRRTIVIEAGLLIGAVLVTAILVGLSAS